MLKKILSLGILLIMLFSLLACNSPEYDWDAPLSGSNQNDGCLVAWPFRCMYWTEKSKLRANEDCTIKLCYGRDAEEYIYLDGYDPTSITATVTMGHIVYGDWIQKSYCYSVNLKEEIILKEISDFADPEYFVQYSSETGWKISETVVIDENWFGGDKGKLWWMLMVYAVFPEESPEPIVVSEATATLYYRIKVDTVFLYNSYTKFENDKRFNDKRK